MKNNNLFEHRPTVVTVEAVTEDFIPDVNGSPGPLVQSGSLRVTDTNGNITYCSLQDFEANYKPKSPIKELGNMKLPNYPGSVVKIFEAQTPSELEAKINGFFFEGINALVLDKQYWGIPPYVCAAFTLNTVVSEDELKERTEIQKIADKLWEEECQKKAEANRTALEIAQKLTNERKAEEARKRQELLADAELGRKCRNNHGKLAKGKK